VKPFEDRDVILAGGRTLDLHPRTATERYHAASGLHALKNSMFNEVFPYVIGGNLAVRRYAALSIGGWSEEFIAAEDLDFSFRLMRRFSTQPTYVPTAVVFHRNRNTDEGLRRQAWRYGEGAAHIYLRYPEVLQWNLVNSMELAWTMSLRTIAPIIMSSLGKLRLVSNEQVEFAYYHRFWTWWYWRGFFSMRRNQAYRQLPAASFWSMQPTIKEPLGIMEPLRTMLRLLPTRIAANDDDFASNYSKALEWIKKNTVSEQGIAFTSRRRSPYIEVTGYLIPTLFDADEDIMARRYAEFLSQMQRPNGSFVGPDGREYVFDTGQALRGLIRACQYDDRFKQFALRAADYVASFVDKDGRIPSPYGEQIPEQIQVFILPALLDASVVFNRSDYREKTEKALTYYKNSPHVLNEDHLTHFLGYTVDGFIDMGESEFVRQFVNKIFSRQRRNGSIPAYPNVKWTCSAGLAQLAIIGYKLGMCRMADRAVRYLCEIQNSSGGFYGSYGPGAEYFPQEEISWANKFFLDAIHIKGELLRGREPFRNENE
jgi:malonyl-CoA O-methyltransferase